MKPNPDQLQALHVMARHNPAVAEFVELWRQAELEQLAIVPKKHSDLVRGRVQLLTELRQYLSPRK